MRGIKKIIVERIREYGETLHINVDMIKTIRIHQTNKIINERWLADIRMDRKR